MGNFANRAVTRTFIAEDGAYYVKPYGVLGRRRIFDSEDDYHNAREYFVKVNGWITGVGGVAGIATVKYGLIAMPLVIVFLVYCFAKYYPTITRNSAKVQ